MPKPNLPNRKHQRPMIRKVQCPSIQMIRRQARDSSHLPHLRQPRMRKTKRTERERQKSTQRLTLRTRRKMLRKMTKRTRKRTRRKSKKRMQRKTTKKKARRTIRRMRKLQIPRILSRLPRTLRMQARRMKNQQERMIKKQLKIIRVVACRRTLLLLSQRKKAKTEVHIPYELDNKSLEDLRKPAINSIKNDSHVEKKFDEGNKRVIQT